MVARAQERPIVFISYAHESDATDQAILALANMLRSKGCEVRTDHPYRDVAPPTGWDKWMEARFREAAKLLVVCTPRLKAIYEESDSTEFLPNYGTGVIYEATLVRNYLRQNRARNTKIIPLLPANGDPESVPDILMPWCNYLRFPTDNERIVRGVSGAEVSQASDEEISKGGDVLSDSPALDDLTDAESLLAAHVNLCIERLAGVQATVFLGKIRARLSTRYPSHRTSFNEARAVVDWMAALTAGEVRRVFVIIRQALLEVGKERTPSPVQQAGAEHAAIALFSLAACRLVDQTAHAKSSKRYAVPVCRAESVVYAVIATALFGGKLELAPEEQSLRPLLSFELEIPAGAEQQLPDEFERAVYKALFRNTEDEMGVHLGSGPLQPTERDELEARIRSHTEVDENSLVLIVNPVVPEQLVANFADGFRVPVMMPILELTSLLLEMTPGQLAAEFKEFRRDLDRVRKSQASSATSSPTQQLP